MTEIYGGRVSRRRFIERVGTLGSGLAAFACVGKEEPDTYRAEVMTFKEGAIVNAVDGLMIEINHRNISFLLHNPDLKINQPDDYHGMVYLLDWRLQTLEDQAKAESLLENLTPYVLTIYFKSQNVTSGREFRGAISVVDELRQLRLLFPKPERDLPASFFQNALSITLSHAWADRVRGALYDRQGNPYKPLSDGEREIIDLSPPIRVTHLEKRLKSIAGIS